MINKEAMIKHILKLIFQQRRKNGWILTELFVVFILLWYMTDFLWMNGTMLAQPTGYSIESVYRVSLGLRSSDSQNYVAYEEGSEEPFRDFTQILNKLQTHPDVEAICLSSNALPYTHGNNQSVYGHDSVSVPCYMYQVTPDYFRVFNICPAGGGTAADLAARLPEGPIISSTMAEKMFGTMDGVPGQTMHKIDDSTEVRIQAVSHAIKKSDYEPLRSALFLYLNEEDGRHMKDRDALGLAICFRIRPGVNATDYADRFRREMKKSLSVGNFWLADVQAYTDIRHQFLSTSIQISVLKMLAVLAGFFLVNVFLAVIGTFWVRVNSRRGEVGLRMAVGSTRPGIRRLMILEGLMLLTLAAIPALMVCVNIAYADLLNTEVMPVTFLRLLADTLFVWCLLALVIVLACWYPSGRSARLEPAEALRYE